MSGRYASIAIWLIYVAAVSPLQAQNLKVTACSACHDQAQKIQESAHSSVACTTCHLRHEACPHPTGVPKPACSQCHGKQVSEHAQSVHGQALKNGNGAAPDCTVCHGNVHEVIRTSSSAFHKAIPDTCGMCHSDIAAQFHSSVHGRAVEQGVIDVPVCTTCHGEHSILSPKNAASPVHPSHIRETCAQCHGNVRLASRFGLPPDRVVSFDASFHGLAAKAGSQTIANCASCHGVHNIFPSSDPRSTINPKNLPATCGRCHPGAGARFALGSIHQLAGGAEAASVRWVRGFYLVVIPMTVGLMFIHNLGDWLRKFFRLRLARAARTTGGPAAQPSHHWTEHEEVRMYGFERLEHVLLLLSFTVLVWTGFALKYPDGWWARPLLAWESSHSVRGSIHRIASVIFMMVAATHIISLIASERLRRHWLTLRPRWTDVREGALNLAFNLGLRSRRPEMSSHSYIEKVEYWAVIWGSVIMTVTGGMLWAHNLILAWLPKTALDFATAVHFYEAVLAALGIVVWHLYSVIFDPEVYPMETAWLTGRGVKRREVEPSETTRTHGLEEGERALDEFPHD